MQLAQSELFYFQTVLYQENINIWSAMKKAL